MYGMPGVNFVCDHVNSPAELVFWNIAIKFLLKLITKETQRICMVSSSLDNPFEVMYKCDKSKYSKLSSVRN